MLFSASLPNVNNAILSQSSMRSCDQQPLHRQFSRSESDINRIEAGLPTSASSNLLQISGNEAAGLLQQASRLLDADYAESMAGLSCMERDLVLTTQTLVEQGAEPALKQTKAGEPARLLALKVQEYLDGDSEQNGTVHARAIGVLDFLGKVINNDFTGDHARWAANLANVAFRTGLIVALTTVVRQLVGFEIEKALQLGDATFSSREIIGFAAMLLGSGLNLAGALRDEINHTATTQSRLSRATMAALSVGALLIASQVGNPSVLSASMSSIGVQTASYTLARDLIQLFFPLHNNATINLGGTLAGGASYSAAQFVTGEAMERFAPSSGAGRVMAVARSVMNSGKAVFPAPMVEWFAEKVAVPAASANTYAVADRVHSAIRALQPDLKQDFTRGVLNAMAEVSDDLMRAGASRALDVKRNQAVARAQAMTQGGDPEAGVAELPREHTEGLRMRLSARLPNATQVADQFLNVSAMRTSAFEIIMGLAMSAAIALEQSSLSEANQAHAVNAVVAGAAALIYPSFVYVDVQSKPASADAKPGRDQLQETELRRRCVSKSTIPP